MTAHWRCVLLGNESLLVQCGQMLEQAGHQIAAVVAKHAAVRRWAAEHGVRVLPAPAALARAVDLGPIDYLFSITNLEVLPPAILALPRRAAINLHDGPLPEYAGLNTPVWALLNGERNHGISWHLMTDRVDEGAVLVERRFPITAGETALTLNTKCFEAAIEGFDELIRGLADGSLRPREQGQAPQRYFGRRHRPEAAGAIRWEQDAERIAAQVRALDFGSYANPIGCAKAAWAGQPLIVGGIRVCEGRSGSAPGTMVAIGDALRVATGGADVELTRIETLDGRVSGVAALVAHFGWRVGDRLDVIDDAHARALDTLNAEVCGHEAFWRARLESAQPCELPQVDRGVALPSPAVRSIDVDVVMAAGEDRVNGVLAALLACIARLTDRDRFDVAFADSHWRARLAGLAGWFSPLLPMQVSVDFSQGRGAFEQALAAERAELRRRGGFASDLVARVPELRSIAADARALPIAVQIVDRLDQSEPASGSELTVALRGDGAATRWFYDSGKLTDDAVRSLKDQFEVLLGASDADPQCALGLLPLCTEAQRREMLQSWNATTAPARTDACVHTLIAEQAARTPAAPAVTCEGRTLSYAELDQRANRLARRLAALGVGPDVLVGLMCERSVELVVGLLAIQKAGGAYVPLDPSYPRERIAYMVEDAKVPVLLTQERLRGELPKHRAKVVCLDSDWASIEAESAEPFDGGAEPRHLAYVIYTSGSTGKPKGVMVEHRNVVNFFAGMDRHLGGDAPGTWLAVTSLSFDISVLELCWTLARGYHVVVSSDEDRSAATARGPHASRPLDFSLFYFSADESEGVTDKYKLLLEGSKYGDQHGFAAVWTPERHFHAFGGLYPNPAVTGAAIAAITERVQIRAGSVVLPLHHPLRVAEEWSVVDNISKGRVGISFASGWQPNDFVLKPENYADNKNVMLRNIEVVRRLWRGESLPFDGPLGKPVETHILPRPVQKELPYWVTSAGNPETFAAAGRIGANVLTHLLGQTVEELKDKIAAYRAARKEAGFAGEGYVSLMLHTFVGPDADAVRAKVRQPLIEYLRTSLHLVKQYAWSFPAFKNRDAMGGIDLQTLSTEEMDALLEHSFERYFETSGLFGTPEHCLKMIDAIKGIGVDDVACLIDFGVDSASVLEHLPYLNELRRLSLPPRASSEEHTLPKLLQRHAPTHLQCTPSMARMLLMDDTAKAGLAGLKRMMVGGEALPPTLARELIDLMPGGKLMNMYGPTETTIWSAVHPVERVEGNTIPLGRPLANQQLYVLDRRQQPLPPGVPGELVIGGAGVVRGYLHRPELTAERFLPHPFEGEAGGRVYRTGDLARFAADGTVEFLGRLDHQVKVRGYRIELGEIEAALLAHEAVREAVVVAREDMPGDVRLVAYLVAHGMAPETETLRDELRGRLPDFMVPAHFVTLAAMPQTPNGKIDRKALPAPLDGAAAAGAPAASYVAPAGDLEEQIAAVWRQVLKLPQVGTRDNFFDLGGHSLLAVQAHRQLRETLGRELSITDIFRFPTIASLSAHLGEGGSDGAAAQSGSDRAQGRRAALQRRQNLRQGQTVDTRA